MTDFAGIRITTDSRMPPGMAALVSPGHAPVFMTGLATEGKFPMARPPSRPVWMDDVIEQTVVQMVHLPTGTVAVGHGANAREEALGQLCERLITRGLISINDARAALGFAPFDFPEAEGTSFVTPAPAATNDGLIEHLVLTRAHADVLPVVEHVRARNYVMGDDGWIHFYDPAPVASYRADTVERIQVKSQ